jgi:hypothetical protein
MLLKTILNSIGCNDIFKETSITMTPWDFPEEFRVQAVHYILDQVLSMIDLTELMLKGTISILT